MMRILSLLFAGASFVWYIVQEIVEAEGEMMSIPQRTTRVIAALAIAGACAPIGPRRAEARKWTSLLRANHRQTGQQFAYNSDVHRVQKQFNLAQVGFFSGLLAVSFAAVVKPIPPSKGYCALFCSTKAAPTAHAPAQGPRATLRASADRVLKPGE